MTTPLHTPGDVQKALAEFDEKGLQFGVTKSGSKIHAVNFDSDSRVVQLTKNGSDKLFCGLAGEFEPVTDPPTSPSRWCQTCLKKVLSDPPEFLGGETG